MLDIDAEATNAPSNLTFDEFRSFQNRERAARETANVKKGSTDDKKKKQRPQCAGKCQARRAVLAAEA